MKQPQPLDPSRPGENRTRAKRRRKAEKKVVGPLDPSRPLPPGYTWYVVETRDNKEYIVAHWVEEELPNSFTLTPLETRWRIPAGKSRRRGGKRQKQEAYQIPFLPRMVIVGFAEIPAWLTMKGHYAVTGVLGVNGTPAPMRRGEAERLQMASERLRKQSGPNPVRAGGKATITAPGLFCGHVVEVKTIQGKNARIVQQWFGSEVETVIELDSLEAAA